jgi:small subunit ribosomal protein S4
MSKYRGHAYALCKLGDLPGLTRKVSNKPNTPGQHGQLRSKLVRNMSPYALRLLEKQKLRFNYNITERHYVMLFKLRSQQVLQVKYYLNLEMRLDNIVYRLEWHRQLWQLVS